MQQPADAAPVALPFDILRCHVRECFQLYEFKSIQAARLVCKLWSEAFFLPAVRVTRSRISRRDSEILRVLALSNRIECIFINAEAIGRIISLANRLSDISHSAASVKNAAETIYFTMFADAEAHNLFEPLRGNRRVKRLIGSEKDAYSSVSAGAFVDFLLSDLLRSNSVLVELDLRNFCVRPEKIVEICDALRWNRTVRALNVSNTRPTQVGLAAICALLETSATLTDLNLAGNNELRDEGAILLAVALQKNKALVRLNFSGTVTSDSGVTALADALKDHPTIEYINLWSNQIHDSGADRLGAMLERNPRITELDLGSNYIVTPRGLAAALSNPNCNLKKLILWSNDLTDQGITYLAEALTKNRSLVALDLGANKYSDSGAIQLAEMLKSNRSLRSLGVFVNAIGDRGLQAFAEVILRENPVLTALQCNNCAKCSDPFAMAKLISTALANPIRATIKW